MKIRAKRPQIKKEGKIYSFRLTVGVKNGKSQRKKFKYKSYKEAKLGLNELMSQKLNKQSDTYSYSITFQQARDYYLQKKRNRGLSEKSVIRYRQYIDNFLTFLKDKRLSYIEPNEVTKRDIKAFIDYESFRGLAPATINEQVVFIADFYETLIDEDYLEKNPVRKRKHKIKTIKKSPVRFSEKELFAILGYTKKLRLSSNRNESGTPWFEFYLTAFFTGFRRDELRELRWENIFLDKERPYMHIPLTKTGEAKDKTIHSELKPYLEQLRLKKSSKFVFPNFNGKIIPKNKATNMLKPICKRLGISKDKAHLHTFRRTFASISREKGLPGEAIQMIGGWKDRKTMESYYINLPPKWAIEQYSKINYLPK